MISEEMEREWRNPRNWQFGIYASKLDVRIIVPKQCKYAGWTINFGHPLGIPTLLLMIGIVVVPAFALIRFGKATLYRIGLLTCASILFTVGFCVWETSRYQK